MNHEINETLHNAQATIAACLNDQILIRSLNMAAGACIDALRQARKIIVIGNGGSAAEAQHIAGELTGRFGIARPALAAISLCSEVAALTAIANDFGYRFVFSRQLEGLGRAGDVLICLSTSGNSENVIEAIRMAKKMQIKVIGMTGDDGGTMAALCDILILAPSDITPRIQECHTIFGHIICDQIELSLFQGLYEKTN